ncbi:hypothetical protein KR222_008724, partial [Zaprionus bogoriensis]
ASMSESTTRTQQRKSYLGLLLLTTCAFLAQGVLAKDSAYDENELHKDNELRTLLKRPAFFVGSRYGRSSGNADAGSGPANSGIGTSKTRRLIIVPRNDRFFLGSRYGKRSDEYLSPYEQNSLGLGMNKAADLESDHSMETVEALEEENVRARAFTGASMTMSCVFTGISNFYRCSKANT